MVSQSHVLALLRVVVLGLICANTTIIQAQTQSNKDLGGSEQGGGSQPAGQVGQGGAAPPLRGSSGGYGLHVVPLIAVSERYDSNVFSSPIKISDFVTTIRPSARAEYRGDLVNGILIGGMFSETYVRNPELNFIGANASLNVSLDNLVGRMLRGLSLSLIDSVSYTPQAQAFMAPEAPESSFLRGVQAYRNNSLTHSASILGGYLLTPVVRFNTNLSYQSIQFFDQTVVTGVGALFDTKVTTLSAGPEYHVSPAQLVSVAYSYTQMAFEPNGGVVGGAEYTTQGVMATWKAWLNRDFNVEVSPGVLIVSNAPGELFWTMRGILRWDGEGMGATLTYSKGVYPNFFIQGAPMVSDLVAVNLSRQITNKWTIMLNANYAKNSSVGQESFRFNSYGGTFSLSYALFRGTVARVDLTHGHFSYEESSIATQFDRQAAMFSLNAEWN